MQFARAAAVALALILTSCAEEFTAQQPTVSVQSNSTSYGDRRFGTVPGDLLSEMIQFKGPTTLGPPAMDRSGIATDRFKPHVLAAGYPLIKTKGIVKGPKFLYISDGGKSGSYDEPARIWRLDPQSKKLSLFYKGDLLVNSKWLYYLKGKNGASDQLIISDYGVEPVPRAPGTGEGAKIFSIPVMKDGTAGLPHVIYEGSPLRSPEGVTVVGRTVIFADWAAGDETYRPDKPDAKFRSGVIFAVPLEGGVPQRLFPEHKWVTLIGSCSFEMLGERWIRFIDIDGGRLEDPSVAALPQSGLPDFYLSHVDSEEPLKLGPLRRVILTEDTLIPLSFAGVRQDDQILLQVTNGARFDDDSTQRLLSSVDLGPSNRYIAVTRSDMDSKTVQVDVSLLRASRRSSIGSVLVDKTNLDSLVPLNNKHCGALTAKTDEPLLHATADGSTATLQLFDPFGGTPVTLWSGEPFAYPMGVQWSWDHKKIYMTDQGAGPNGTSAIFEIDVPSLEERWAMFPHARTGIAQ